MRYRNTNQEPCRLLFSPASGASVTLLRCKRESSAFTWLVVVAAMKNGCQAQPATVSWAAMRPEYFN